MCTTAHVWPTTCAALAFVDADRHDEHSAAVAMAEPDRRRPEEPALPLPAASATPSLLRRIAARDTAAIDELLRMHRGRLEVAVRSSFPRELRRRLDEEDLVQTVLHKAITNLDRFHYTSSGSFLRWLVTIAVNALRDELKAHRSDKRDLRRETHLDSAVLPVEGTLGHTIAARQATPSQHAIGDETQKRLEQGLEQLSPTERDLVVDGLLLGVEIDELAERHGRTREAARVALFRAKARLAAWFEAGTGSEP
jgi:RNA polymerase sigma-70 factor (ECF subfamily)